MHIYNLVTRAIVVLLVARAVAAPVSLRRRDDGPPTRSVLVVRRAYGWPQQRFERISHASKLLKSFPGRDRPATEHGGLLRGHRAIPISSPALTSSLAPGTSGERPRRRPTDRLRC
jgi:hypothetical protein